jgi:SOS-response transcriptional repressor LexA
MTELQLQAFEFIRDRIVQTGVAPTYPEIARATGSKSRSGAHAMVNILVRLGLLEKTGAGSRNLKLPGINLVAVPTPALVSELDRRNA